MKDLRIVLTVIVGQLQNSINNIINKITGMGKLKFYEIIILI